MATVRVWTEKIVFFQSKEVPDNGYDEWPNARFVVIPDGVLMVNRDVELDGKHGEVVLAMYNSGAWQKAEFVPLTQGEA